MKTSKRILTLILAGLMTAAAFTGCSESTENAEPKEAAAETSAEIVPAAEEVAEEVEITRENTPDTLPDDLDFDGLTVSILCRGSVDEIEVHSDELTGEAVSDSIYNRNAAVAERLNVTYEYRPIGTSSAQEFPAEAKNSVTANSDDYSIFAWCQYSVLPLCLQGLIMDINSAPYLDFSMPWWNTSYMDTIQIGNDKRFFLMGDVCLTFLKNMSSCFFNNALYNDIYGDYNDVYNAVLEGTWDIDMLYELAEGAYQDANGNGKKDKDDVYGVLATTVATTDHFAFDMGMTAVGRDEEGLPTAVFENERNYAVADKMNELYWNNNGMMKDYGDGDIWLGSVGTNLFAQNKFLFMMIWLQSCEQLRDMENDYSILPYPKLDETQENYFTLVHDCASMWCLPITCGHRDEVCAVIEAMCAENYRTVVPAYYDVALKSKYSRDEVTAQMIDLLHDTAATDFGYAYNYSCGEIGTIMRSIVASNGSYASSVAKIRKVVSKTIDRLISAYTGE